MKRQLAPHEELFDDSLAVYTTRHGTQYVLATDLLISPEEQRKMLREAREKACEDRSFASMTQRRLGMLWAERDALETSLARQKASLSHIHQLTLAATAVLIPFLLWGVYNQDLDFSVVIAALMGMSGYLCFRSRV